MKRIGRSTKTDTRVEVTQAYDVRSCGNGLIVGSVRYAFVNGDGVWCFAIALHSGMVAHGKAKGEFEPFEPVYAEPTWQLPVVQRPYRQSVPMIDPAHPPAGDRVTYTKHRELVPRNDTGDALAYALAYLDHTRKAIDAKILPNLLELANGSTIEFVGYDEAKLNGLEVVALVIDDLTPDEPGVSSNLLSAPPNDPGGDP